MSNSHFSEKKFIVSIDEFERGDVFLLGHLLISEQQANVLERKWLELQRKIKKSLISRNSKASRDIRLSDNLLPEIHAEWLCQSSEYYRWKDASNKEYWKEHFEWLEDALRIIKHVSPQILFSFQIGYRAVAESKISNLRKNIATLFPDLDRRESLEVEDLFSMMRIPYGQGFAVSVLEIDAYLREQKKSAKLICDNYDQCRGFSQLEIYNLIREHNFMNHLTTPAFLSSEDEVFIQAIDICCYVQGQKMYINHMESIGKPLKADFKVKSYLRLAKQYITPYNRGANMNSLNIDSRLHALGEHVFWELARRKLSKSSSLRQAWQASANLRIQQLLDQK